MSMIITLTLVGYCIVGGIVSFAWLKLNKCKFFFMVELLFYEPDMRAGELGLVVFAWPVFAMIIDVNIVLKFLGIVLRKVGYIILNRDH